MSREPEHLFAALFDHTITPEQFEALSRWLEQDPRHARRFVEWSLLEERVHELVGTHHSAIEQLLAEDDFELRPATDASDSAVLEAVIAEAVATRRRAEIAERAEHLLAAQRSAERPHAVKPDPPKDNGPLLIIIPRWVAYAAAVLLVAGMLGLILTGKPDNKTDSAAPIAADQTPSAEPEKQSEPHRFAARLSDQNAAHWADHSPRPDADGSLPPGRYTLERGYLRVAFGDGVDSILHGPIQFSIDPDYRLTISEGKLWSRVSPQGVGFTVFTPTGRFVDLGTAFGVEVQPSGRSALHVTEGRVDAYPKYGSAIQPPMATLAGHAVETTEDGRSIYPTAWVPHRFAVDWQQTDLGLAATGDIELLHSPPPSLAQGQLEHDDKIFVIKERDGIRLEQPVRVDITEPGTYAAWPVQRATIGAGERVNSYLLHYDRIGNIKDDTYATAVATIKFDQPIIAVITRTQTLKQSDGVLGAADVGYDAAGLSRGLEQRSADPTININAQDTVVISEDRKALSVTLKAHTNTDHIRVITRAAP